MYWTLAIIFGIFFIIDILGHIILHVKRKAFEWILMSLVIILAIGSITMGFLNTFRKDKRDASDLFVEYNYLMDGNISRAEMKLATVGGEYEIKAQVLGVMSSLIEQDYIQGYFKSERLLESGVLKGIDRKYIKKVQQICKEEIGLSEKSEEKYTDYADYIADLEETQITYSNGGAYDVDTEKTKEAIDIAKDYMDEMKFSDKQVEDYTQDYEMDSKLYGQDISEITESDLEKITEEYSESEDVLRLYCKYYINIKDYETAKKYAQKLINKFRNEENYVIYTDIIAQETYSDVQQKTTADITDGYYNDSDNALDESYDVTNDTDSKSKDKEVQKLIKKAREKQKQAERIQNNYEDDDITDEIQEKIDKLLSEANDLYAEADYVDIKRAINYILAKKPKHSDDTGMYNLQLAKLYLIMGDRENANKYLYEVIDNSVDISDSSVIKEALDEVVEQYNKLTSDEYNSELNAAVDALIDAQTNGVVPSDESTINGSFNSYVTNTLKYDKLNIHISRIDKSEYPKIKAYVNINGDKEGKNELASDFKENDFTLIDTLYEIDNFKILSDKSSSKVSIAIVMDKSGSMLGSPIDNAKMAAVEAVNYMEKENEKISIIAYADGAENVQKLTDSHERLKRAINSIESDGGTNIAGGLNAGIDEIKDETGSRAIILMSDGQDGNTAAMPEAIQNAVDEGIAVYTVAFGDADEEYMKDIADKTGGKFIKASSSSELSDIYLTLQKYIVNNYCIEYTVEKNVETDPRNLMVSIDEYSTSDNKDYYIKEENKPDGEDEKDSIEKIDENTLGISSVTPGTTCIKDVSNGIDVIINGGGFEDGMNISIGKIPLTNVKIESKTKLTATLKGILEPGRYDIQIKTSDGRLIIANKMFSVFKSGTTKSIRLGGSTITADAIGQISDNKLLASGNVMLNGFVHSAGDMEITVNGMDKDIDLNANSSVYVGESGTLSGNSKLYVSYKQMSEANGQNFTTLVMGGKDYVIQKHRYSIDVDSSSAGFDNNICDFDLSIPLIMDVDVAEVNLYSNRLQIDVKSIRLDEIVKDVNKSLTHKKGANEPEPTPVSRADANKFDIKDAGDIGVSIALTPDGIEFGGEAEVNVNDALQFGTFGIKSIKVKLNSLDADNEYWSIGGEIDFSRLMPGFGGTGIEGLEGSLSSYYWLPDKVSIDASLNPGIPIYKIIEINKVGGSLQGMSTGILKLYETIVSPETYKIIGTDIKSDAYDYQDVILAAKLGAEANIFNVIDVSNNKLFKKFKEWGEIGNIDGKIEINFSEPEFVIGADMSLLGSEKASAEAKINKSGLDIAANVKLNISGFGMEIDSGADANVGGNLTGAYMKAGLNGKLDCAPLKIHINGEASFKIEFEWDFEYAAVTVNYKDGAVNKEGTIWYDADGGPFIWNKIGTSSN